MASSGINRYKNGNFRRKARARFKAIDAPCGICHGKYGRIHYEEPSDSKHPLSFVIDEIRPVSKWKEFGYESQEASLLDMNNLQAAHYYCNALKSNKTGFDIEKPMKEGAVIKANISDGEW